MGVREIVKKVLEKFSMEKSVSTLLANHFKLSVSQCPKTGRN